MTFESHPAADLFPMMTHSDLETLAADIEANGLMVPIVLHDGLILDGRNRLQACEIADIVPSLIKWEGTGDPTQWVVSQNLHRRHLTESQRAMVAARLATLGHGGDRSKGSIDPLNVTQSEAAEVLSVSVPSVKRARVVQEHGIPALTEAVDAGEVAVSKAAQIARLPKEEQAPAVEEARKPHVSHNSGENEWYTPGNFVEAARSVLGGIDLDPASCAQANETVKAAKFFDIEANGLEQPWSGRVWMNPPYSRGLCAPFCEKLANHHVSGDVTEAIVLVNNATDTEWWQGLANVATAVCFPSRRVRFIGRDGEKGAPLQGQSFLYLGNRVEVFCDSFSRFGVVLAVK